MRIAVAMSGGVDSLRTAVLLKEQGNEVFGLHMRFLPLPGNGAETEDLVRRREQALTQLAARYGIPLEFIGVKAAFESHVVSPFVSAYHRGLTPNPCVLCNPSMKFGLLREHAVRLGADRFATGHYAQIVGCEGEGPSKRVQLRRAKDLLKDQSYFLMGLSQEQLAHSLFPLGAFSKRETISWAENEGLGPLFPEDSQEVCFIPSGSYREFMLQRLGGNPGEKGPILDLNGHPLGEHHGIYSYTIGQRRGLGISSNEPYYVISLEPESNAVRVGRSNDLFCSRFLTTGVNWVSIPPPDGPVTCEVRIRNQHRPARAEIARVEGGNVVVRFDEPQRAVTPGQAAVFYAGDLLLGGGAIAKSSF